MGEYLKRYDNMDAGERYAIARRVGEWLSSSARMLLRRAEETEAQMQSVMQVCVGWNDQECLAWEEGARLLTAFSSMTDTWLPDRLYGKAAYRSIRRMVKCLKTMGEPDGARPAAPQGQNVAGTKPEAMPTGKAAKPGRPEDRKADTPQDRRKADARTAVVPRPKHIDQYVHVLPKKTQERAARYGGLMRSLEEARENMRRLMTDPNATDREREQWAKTATRIDTQVKSIRKELDAEWEKAVKSGRVTVDGLGNAHVHPAGESDETAAGLTAEQKARVKQLRNFLRDTRGPKEPGDKRDAYVKKWVERFREMVRTGGQKTVTGAVASAAKAYGIDVDQITL